MLAVPEPLQTQGSVYGSYLRVHEDSGLPYYAAGFPGYTHSFSRDVLMAGIATGDADLLEKGLGMAAYFQGTKDDPNTREELGKIHHQIPGVSLPGRKGLTTYNACDTTALFLIAAEALLQADRPRGLAFAGRHRRALQRAARYIKSHLTADDLFEERPPKGAKQFNLRVTYWKDSVLPGPWFKLEPTYPVIYPQAHFVVARGMLAASRLLENQDYTLVADRMFVSGIRQFIRLDGFTAYRDRRTERTQSSSDELHALAYIPAEYNHLLPLKTIWQRAKQLSTPYGYLCAPIELTKTRKDRYHVNKVWPVDQMFIHYGASKHGLKQEAGVAARVAPHIGEGQELFDVRVSHNGRYQLLPDGNPRQLWSVAAAEYFAGRSLLHTDPWL